MKWPFAVALLAVGCASGSADPFAEAWSLVGGTGSPPVIEFVEADCGLDDDAPGMSVWNAEARTTYCMAGQSFAPEFVRIATWPGATTRDVEMARRIVHEFQHSQIMATRDWDGDPQHTGPEWEHVQEMAAIVAGR